MSNEESNNLVLPEQHYKKTNFLVSASRRRLEVKRYTMVIRPEERQVPILSTCQQYGPSGKQGESSVLHSCDWRFVPAATSMAMSTG